MKKLQDMTDEELALSYVDGNNRAFDLLLSRNQSKLFSYILFRRPRPRDSGGSLSGDLRQGHRAPTGRQLYSQRQVRCVDDAHRT